MAATINSLALFDRKTLLNCPKERGARPETDNGDGTRTVSYASGSVTFASSASSTNVLGGSSASSHDITFTARDVSELLNLVRGLPSEALEESGATGIRILEGTGNNIGNPDWGSADQAFIRLTQPRYGAYDEASQNRAINPIFDGLDPRNISNILGTQEADLAKSDAGANIFFMAFGQYFDHGLDFLPKGGNGTVSIGNGNDNPADLTRGSIANAADVANGGTPQHINKTSPFVDQNQAYGSTDLVGQFLRESDGNGGLGAKLLSGGTDPSNSAFDLLPTLREAILEHWENNTLFSSDKLGDQGYANGEVHFCDYFTVDGTPLVDANGNINEMMAHGLNQNFMGSGHTLVGDANNFIDILDHYVAGDLRANENYTLTSIHTVWARNHNYHVEKPRGSWVLGQAPKSFTRLPRSSTRQSISGSFSTSLPISFSAAFRVSAATAMTNTILMSTPASATSSRQRSIALAILSLVKTSPCSMLTAIQSVFRCSMRS